MGLVLITLHIHLFLKLHQLFLYHSILFIHIFFGLSFFSLSVYIHFYSHNMRQPFQFIFCYFVYDLCYSDTTPPNEFISYFLLLSYFTHPPYHFISTMLTHCSVLLLTTQHSDPYNMTHIRQTSQLLIKINLFISIK